MATRNKTGNTDNMTLFQTPDTDAENVNQTIDTDAPENKPTLDASALAGLFSSTAANAVSGSSVIGNLKKYKGRDIAAAYPDGVFIADFDIISVRDRNTHELKPVSVYNFSDSVSGAVIGFTMGGAVIGRLVNDWISKIGGGDIDTARDLYKRSGSRVRVTLSYEMNESTGNTIQKVKVN